MQPTNFVKKPIFTGVGIVVIIIAIMTSSYYMTKKNINLAYNTIKIAQLENNAFGSLQSNQSEEPVNIQNLAGVGSGGGGGELASSIAGINGGSVMPVSFSINSTRLTFFNSLYKTFISCLFIIFLFIKNITPI